MANMVQVRRGRSHSYNVPDVQVGRSQFNRSFGRKMTFDASYLYPLMIDEVLPGDTMTCELSGYARLFSPLDAPIMDNIELETFFFFVPTRLLWSHWEEFNGFHDAAGAQDVDYTIPVLDTGLTVNHDQGVSCAQLAAYFGVPHGLQTAQVDVSALPFRAYNFIWSEWFRDQNVDAELPHYETADGPDGPGAYNILKSAKKHDYFTSCLPYLQKGDAVTIPLGTVAPIYTATTDDSTDKLSVYGTIDSSWHEIDSSTSKLTLAAATGDEANKLYADLSSATAASINQLREALAIQTLLERDARGGTRLVEMIKSQFGVTVPDFRAQRPEYLGGGKAYINITPVANTSATATEDQGELRGIGAGIIRGHGWAKSFVEHGYIIGLVRARGALTYFQGLDRMWSRSTRYDFYLPALANLGEQSVLKKELYVSNSPATDDAVFGYQERWAEYRTKKSEIVGKFNPDVSGSLSFWHLAEDFSSAPALNTTFIYDQTPMSRVTTVDSEPDFLMDVWFDYKCARPLPVYSIPSLMTLRF